MASMKRMGLVAVLVTVMGLATLAAFANVAQATANDEQPVTSTTNSLDMSVTGAEASAQDIASGRVTVLGFVMTKGVSKKAMSKARAQHGCMMIGKGTKVPGFWNSGRGANGKIFWFWDTRRTSVCKIGGTWRKVGPHNCGNLIRFSPPKSNIVTGKVIVVRNLANVQITLHASVMLEVHASCGFAMASGSATITVKVSVFVKAQGNIVTSLFASAQVNAWAKVKLSCITAPPPPSGCTVNCTPPPPGCKTDCTPPPVAHSCSIMPIQAKDGRTYDVTVATQTNGPQSTISWGDGASSPGLQASHTYGSDGSFTVSANVHFNDGGSASCATGVTAKLVTPPPTPPGDPGPNPPDDPGPPPPDPNNGGVTCPPGWNPDGNGGCVPAP